MDKIIVKGLKVFAYHGVNPEEKRDGQTFELDITAETDLTAAAESDTLADTISYAQIAKAAARVMTEQSYDLLEKAAMRVIEQLLADFPAIQSVEVLLKKPQAPVKLEFDYMAVTLRRER